MPPQLLVPQPLAVDDERRGLGRHERLTFALTNNLAGAFSVEYTINLADSLPLDSATPRCLFTHTNAPAVPERHYRLRWPYADCHCTLFANVPASATAMSVFSL